MILHIIFKLRVWVKGGVYKSEKEKKESKH